MSGTGFLAKLKPLNAQRLQKSVKATVQNSGRLTFAMDAIKEMELSEDKSIIILAADDGDLGAVISDKGDPDAFVLKKCGAYFYVTFKNYLQQTGVDYKSQRIIYDITELDEVYKGKTLYKFARRIIRKGCDEDVEAEKEEAGTSTGTQKSEDASQGERLDSSDFEMTDLDKGMSEDPNGNKGTEESMAEQPVKGGEDAVMTT